MSGSEPAKPSALRAGMEVTANVRLVSPLGAGGMGAVWLADHTALNTRVVVKFMLSGLDSSTSARTRFKREAEAASQVKSPHVVQTFDYGLTSEGVPFIVMEHLEGHDLAAEIAKRGALEPRVVVAVVTQVAKALAKAHTAGLLHRDIKPDNIFLCETDGDGEIFAKLLDFGIAKAHTADGEGSMDGETKTGQVVGTPFYMSPEQVQAHKVIDLRSDLWSLGIVAFEALTGKRPYDGPSFGALAVKIATGECPKPSDANPALPPSVDAWFAQACARHPDERFVSARELADRLRAAFDGVVSLPMSSSSGTRSKPGESGGVSLPPQVSVPAGPISVDHDANERPSFVLASTVNESGADHRSALARSEPGGASVAIAGAEKRGKGNLVKVLAVAGLLAGVAVVALTLGSKPAGDPGATGTAGTRSGPSFVPSSAPAPPPTSSLPMATASAVASAPPPAAPDAAVAPPVLAATSAARVTLPPPGTGRPHTIPSSKPTASAPAVKPTSTTHDDPLF